MKAIVLSAGQGKRLLPLTATLPKCLLRVQGRTILEWQIDQLRLCGIDQIAVVTGYRAGKVDELLCRRYGFGATGLKTIYNRDYAASDNLVSCWAARGEMTEDFILLNGDTLFEANVLKTLMRFPANPVIVGVSHKGAYDDDDMKVKLERCRLIQIGKNIPQEDIHGESIGMIRFHGRGPALFRRAMACALREPGSAAYWYLAVIDQMACRMPVWSCSIDGLKWCEVDYPSDLNAADRVVAACKRAEGAGLCLEDCHRQANMA
jgi:choline kinase